MEIHSAVCELLSVVGQTKEMEKLIGQFLQRLVANAQKSVPEGKFSPRLGVVLWH
jgi:hypothetical protein